MFTSDLELARELYALLLTRQDNAIAFEKRFETLRLHFPFEDLLANRRDRGGEYHYCFYANARGVRFVRTTAEDFELARKVKTQETLTWLEKERALALLLRLSTGDVLRADLQDKPIFYGNG